MWMTLAAWQATHGGFANGFFQRSLDGIKLQLALCRLAMSGDVATYDIL
jgi:hypothetical protein